MELELDQDLRTKQERLDREVGLLSANQEGLGSFAETTRSMVLSAYLWLMVLSGVAAIEAIAIIALWWRR